MKKKNTPKSVRLDKDITPRKYNIEIKPNLLDFTFSGIETIELALSKPTKAITLHSKEIEINTASIMFRKGLSRAEPKEKVFAKSISYNEQAQTATFLFDKTIPGGSTKLTLVFKGILNDKMRGFYRSKYFIDGKECHMATTQFEATDARRAFPCFDEPAHKAVFDVSLVVPKGKTAISNTLPVSVTEHEAGYEIVKFCPTPKMSTYLLAFIVGDFEYLEKKSNRGVIVRVYTVPGKKHQAKFALDCAVRTLDFYEKYFDIKYPLNTLDMIAIPDFSSGAMENWGAITYRESALLVDAEHSSASNKQWVALVIAHEIAHQWFGNLVTMEWWTHLWLNEGFASYIEYLAVDKLFPKWDIWTQFATNDLGVALRLDALLHTHPIEIKVHHPDEIGEIFDEVSYCKGASIIRMLADYLGEENFRDGLRYYLKKHSYKNTETLHLWQAFEKVSKKPVAKIMQNWTSKPGYPVVKAEIKNNKLELSQSRFFASPISKQKEKDKTIWELPIKFLKINPARGLASDGKPTSEIFKLQKFRTEQEFDFQNDSLKLNFGEAGFFRTAYSKELLERLRQPIQDKSLSPRDRLGVVRDLFALSEAGIIPTTDALEFISAYKEEDNYTVWVEIASGLARIEQLLGKDKLVEKLNIFTIELFSPVLNKLGWEKPASTKGGKEGELHSDALLRSLAISRLGRAGDKRVVAEAKKQFSLIKQGKGVNPDIRGAIYATVATNGGKKEYAEFIKLYKKETLHEEKNRLGSALGDFKEDKILWATVEFALSKDVRPQDSVGILSSVGANPLGRDIWIKAIKYNWKILLSRYGDGGMALSRVVKAISGSAESKHYADYKKFFDAHEAPGAKRAVDQVLERLEGNIAWLKRDKKAIGKFLKNI